MRIRLASVVLLVVFSSVMSGAGASLSPGQTLVATFTSVSNTSDMIIFFSTGFLTVTGSPVLTTQLLNGTTLLGTITAAPSSNAGNYYYEVFFDSASSVNTETPGTVVDLSSMQNGTIQGVLKVTVSGGSISGLNLPMSLLDGESCGSGCYFPESDLKNENFSITGTALAFSVPTLSEWGLILLAIALIGVGIAALGRAPATRRVSG
jgi:hypothetical protein